MGKPIFNLYDNEDILFEFDGANVLQARYTHGLGIDEPLVMERDINANQSFETNEAFYYHADGLSSIVDLTDSTGAVAQSYVYDSFGQIITVTSGLKNPYTFTSREYDEESGLYFYRERYYDPAIGRFITEDPVDFVGGVNFYTYAVNNPINILDPFGLYGTNSCEYYQKRCKEAGGEYYCKSAPKWCNAFPKYPDPDPSRDDDFEGWARCTRQCLQDCDAQSSGSCSDGKPEDKSPWDLRNKHTQCHALCYTACYAEGIGTDPVRNPAGQF